LEEYTHMYSPPDKYAYQPSMQYQAVEPYFNTDSHGAYGFQPFSHIDPMLYSKDNANSHGVYQFQSFSHIDPMISGKDDTNSHGTYGFQPFSHIDPMLGSQGNNYLPVYTQYDGGQPAAPPHMPTSELVNSNEDQSSAIASAAQESAWSSGDAGSAIQEIQETRKRGRSTRDSSGSLGEETKSLLRELESPESQSPRRPTKKSKTVAAKPSVGDQDNLQSSTAQPVLQAQNKRLEATTRVSRRKSLLAADYSGVKIAPDKLRRMSREEARAICENRKALEIVGDDNVDEIRANPDKWIRAIVDTFDAPYKDAPETKAPTPEKLLKFRLWQKENYAATMEHFSKHKDKNFAEAVATSLYYAVVDAHERGYLIKSSGTSFKHEEKLTCKDRMEKIIHVLKALTLVRKDLVYGCRLAELVAGPGHLLKRKEENKQGNDKKPPMAAARKALENAKKEADVGFADKDTENDIKKANKKDKPDQKKARNKATTNKKQGAKGNAAVVNSDERSASVSSENGKTFGTGVSSDADRSASFDRNDSISVPDATSVDDEETGADQGSSEEGEESSADD
jgi:hypothetical protein